MSLDIHDPDLADYDPYIWDTEYFRTKQQQDQFCEEKIRKLQAEASQELRNTFSIGENGLLYKAGQDGHQLVVPVRMRGEVLKCATIFQRPGTTRSCTHCEKFNATSGGRK